MPLDPAVLKALEAIRAGSTADSQESETLDFKLEKGGRADTEKDLVEATLCFANASGGSVVVGVRNKPGGPGALVGATLDVRELKQRIFELTNPHLAVDVEATDFHGVRLVVIRAPESPEIHADRQGRAPRRINTECVNMSPAEQIRHREDRRGVDWSLAASDRDPDDVSPRAVAVARDLLARHPTPSGRHLLGSVLMTFCASLECCAGMAAYRARARCSSAQPRTGLPDWFTYTGRRRRARRSIPVASTTRSWSPTNASWISYRLAGASRR